MAQLSTQHHHPARQQDIAKLIRLGLKDNLKDVILHEMG
jgi:hypothetical protein